MLARLLARVVRTAGRPPGAALAAALAACTALAQPAPPPPPLPPEGSAGTAPAQAPFTGDSPDEPQVTIIRRDGETVEEVRIGGNLKFVRVTPAHGRPYYLIPDPNGNQFIRRDSLDSGLKVPLWVLFSW
jgi:hypothetical protein